MGTSREWQRACEGHENALLISLMAATGGNDQYPPVTLKSITVWQWLSVARLQRRRTHLKGNLGWRALLQTLPNFLSTALCFKTCSTQPSFLLFFTGIRPAAWFGSSPCLLQPPSYIPSQAFLPTYSCMSSVSIAALGPRLPLFQAEATEIQKPWGGWHF